MTEFQITLIVLGTLAIGGILVHGLWTIRKQNKPQRKEPVTQQVISAKAQDGFDEFGVGQVRVVGGSEPQVQTKEDNFKTDDFVAESKETPDTVRFDEVESPFPEVSTSEHEPTNNDLLSEENLAMPEEKKTLVKSALDSLVSSKKQPRNRRSRREPKMSADQMGFNFSSDTSKDEGQAASRPKSSAPASNKQAEAEEVLVLNVMVPEGAEMSGAKLLPAMLTLGLKYGDMSIFHRHQDSAGHGSALFSVANMFKPGIFDVDNMENFTTRGVTLFMTLPLEEGDSLETFHLMHNAATQLAHEFSGQVLDISRSVLTKQTVQHYVEKIREFERKRLLVSQSSS